MKDDEILYLLCGAFYELNQNSPRGTPRIARFQQEWEKRMRSQIQEEEHSVDKDNRGCSFFLSKKKQSQEQKEYQRAVAAAQELQQQLTECQSELVQKERELDMMRKKLQEYTKGSLPDQSELQNVAAFLQNLPEAVVQVISSYFNCGSLMTFLMQCGQFNRLTQFWGACSKIVSERGELLPLTECLEYLLALYNRSSSDTPAAIIAPQPHEPYNYETAQRVKSDGMIVSQLLLPGLRNPGGKVIHKALVRLE